MSKLMLLEGGPPGEWGLPIAWMAGFPSLRTLYK